MMHSQGSTLQKVTYGHIIVTIVIIYRNIMRSVSVSDFKAHCINYMKLTQSSREIFLITKHGKPIAKLVPVDILAPDEKQTIVFDKLKDCTVLHGNILDPIDTPWDVLSE